MNDCQQPSRRELIEAIRIFGQISSKHFKVLINETGFPKAEYNDSIRNILRDFLEKAFPSIGVSTPKRSVSHQFFDPDTLMTAWEATHILLQDISADLVICNWVKQVRGEYLKYSQRENSTAWNFLLYEWSLDPSRFPLLPIELDKIQEIRILALKQRSQEYDLHFRMPKIQNQIDMDAWETFLVDKLKTGESISRRIYLHRWILRWVNTFKLLDEDEIIEFDNWGHEIIKQRYNHDHYFILMKLKSDLEEDGYFRLNIV